jgi:hydrogen peroxide-dependent heme synthase
MPEIPQVPLTLEGAPMLHQFFRFDWAGWRQLPASEQAAIASEAVTTLQSLASPPDEAQKTSHQTALFSQLGHKGDLIFVHLRPTFEDLNRVELALAQTRLHDFLDIAHSFLSVVELGLYESTSKTYGALAARDIAPHTPEWNASIRETLDRQATAMHSRLFPMLPDHKYICFYPMDRLRGEDVNWYTESLAERGRMMHEHGLVGRRYADEVRQIISGSIGLDDWEWGVDLFAEDPITFKKIIYEMRFDEVSAKFGLFGDFFVGVKLPFANLPNWLQGKL